MPAASYEAGVKAAFEHYGLHRGMPRGPKHLGAERFAAKLQDETDSYHSRFSRPATRESRMNRPTMWSNPVPMDSGSMGTQGGSGVGAFGGV
jgi:hypothetical protein